MQTYEVVIYNEQVRELVRVGESHKHFSDDWGDSHYIDIKADSEEQAIAKIREKYPEDEGFVIEGVSPA